MIRIVTIISRWPCESVMSMGVVSSGMSGESAKKEAILAPAAGQNLLKAVVTTRWLERPNRQF